MMRKERTLNYWIEEKKLSPKDFIKFQESLLKDFYYEIYWTRRIFRENRFVFEHPRLAFLLHLRNIHEFFHGREFKDTVLVSQYLPSWQNKPIRKEIRDQISSLNKFVTHLTYSRHDSKNDFNEPELYKYVRSLTIDFLTHLSKTRWITPNLNVFLKELDQEVKGESNKKS